jgi:hypothetical protein
MPQRIQRLRTKGWRMPQDAIYVGRPTRWGNPCQIIRKYFVVDENGYEHYTEPNAERAVAARLFRDALFADRLLITVEDVDELRGRDLACWCPLDQPCHADVLLEIANQEVAH